jgi:serine/threonine protein phosphatase PrpC
MSAIPEVSFLPRKSGIVILGSDGLFDGFPDLGAMLDMVTMQPIKTIPSVLVDYAKNRNSEDDTTCIAILI